MEPAWRRFVADYPDAPACAAAPLGDVLRRWSGLGYPRRARNLHAAAGRIAAEHGGVVPDSLDELVALPGVGPYTARAVLAFAFERDVAPVDTNIARVLARVSGGSLPARRAQGLADSWVPPGEGWAWNQVLMDLGSTVCRPVPRCEQCPLARCCRWSTSGRPAPDPAAGSAHTSRRQPRYEGSIRQARGALLRRLIDGGSQPVVSSDRDVVAGLVSDGLVTVTADTVHLP